MTTQTTPTIKTLKKEKSMYTNMETFLKNLTGVTADIIAIDKAPKAKEGEELEFFPTHRITGTVLSLNGKKSNFFVEVSRKDYKEKNGMAQVLLNIETKKGEFIQLKPDSNGQLGFMVKSFEPIPAKTKMEMPLEVKAEKVKEEKVKEEPKKEVKETIETK